MSSRGSKLTNHGAIGLWREMTPVNGGRSPILELPEWTPANKESDMWKVTISDSSVIQVSACVSVCT